MASRWKMTRRTAGWLVAIVAALFVYHWAFPSGYSVLPASISPAVTVTGEITALNPPNLTLQLTDPKGQLTTLTRTVRLTTDTRYRYPGQPEATGTAGLNWLRPGLRVTVVGQSPSASGDLTASSVSVQFPPVTGVVQSVRPGTITLTIAGSSQPMNITVTPSTAFYFPQGDQSTLKPGAKVNVTVVPNNSSGVQALAVEVVPAASAAKAS